MSLKEQWVSWDELYAFIAGGLFDPNVIIDAGNVGGLTAGSIPFANATGFLTEDNAALFWDATSEYLKITSATALLIDLYPGFTGTGEVIKITPSAAIDTIDAEWSGILIDGDALDPSAIGVHIDALHIDFSTIDITNLPHIDAIHIQMPSCLCGMHGIHLDGELHVNLDTTVAVTGEEYTGIDVVVATTGSTGGDIHVLDVARGGIGAVGIAAIGTHEGIDVIHQAIGTFAAADKIWEYDNDGPTWIDVTAGVGSIWDDKDDLLYVGHASTFSEIKFIFTVVATKDMHFKFYFSAGAAVWTPFEPADDTNGATQNGSVRFTAASLPTWAVDTVNAIANKYWIMIERTRTSGTGPTTSLMQQLAPTLYGWDKLGAITALSVDLVNTITEFSTDGTLGGNSDAALPTEKAVKTYADALPAKENLIKNSGFGVGSQSVLTDIDAQINVTDITAGVCTTANTQNLQVGDLVKFNGGGTTLTNVYEVIAVVVNTTFTIHDITITDPAAVNCDEATPAYIVADVYAPDHWTKTATLDLYRWFNHTTYHKGVFGLKVIKGADGAEYLNAFGDIFDKDHHYLEYRSRTITLGCWIYSDSAIDNVKLQINDSDGTTESSFVVADTLTWVEITRTCGAAITFLTPRILFDGDTADEAYVSRLMLVFGSSIGEGNYQPRQQEIVWCKAPITSNLLEGLANTSDVPFTDLNLEADSDGKIPKGCVAVQLYSAARDTGSAGIVCYLSARADAVQEQQHMNFPYGKANDTISIQTTWQRCDINGDIDYLIEASGANTMDVLNWRYLGIQVN